MSLNIARAQNLHLTEPSSDAEQRRPGYHHYHPGKQHYFVLFGEDITTTTTTTGSKSHQHHAESPPSSLVTTRTTSPTTTTTTTTKTTDARMLKSLVKSAPNLLFPGFLSRNKTSPNDGSSSSKIPSNYKNNKVLNNQLQDGSDDHNDNDDDDNDDENDDNNDDNDDDDDTVLEELSPLECRPPMDSPTEAMTAAAAPTNHHNNHTETTTTNDDRSMATPSLVGPKEAGEWTRTTKECKSQDRHGLSATDPPNPENGSVPFAVSSSTSTTRLSFVLWVWIGFTVVGMFWALQWHSFYPLDVVGGGGGLTLQILAVLLRLLPLHSRRATTTTTTTHSTVSSSVCLLLYALKTLWIQCYVQYHFHTQQIWQLVRRHTSLDSYHPPHDPLSHDADPHDYYQFSWDQDGHSHSDHHNHYHYHHHHFFSSSVAGAWHRKPHVLHGHPVPWKSLVAYEMASILWMALFLAPYLLSSSLAVVETTLHYSQKNNKKDAKQQQQQPQQGIIAKAEKKGSMLGLLGFLACLVGLVLQGVILAPLLLVGPSHHHPQDHSSQIHHNPHNLATATTLHGLEEAADGLSTTLNLSFRQIMDWGELLFWLGMFALNVQALWQRSRTISWLASFLLVAAIVWTAWLLQLKEPEKETASISSSSSSKMESSLSLSSSVVWLAALATAATRATFLRYNVFLVEAHHHRTASLRQFIEATRPATSTTICPSPVPTGNSKSSSSCTTTTTTAGEDQSWLDILQPWWRRRSSSSSSHNNDYQGKQ